MIDIEPVKWENANGGVRWQPQCNGARLWLSTMQFTKGVHIWTKAATGRPALYGYHRAKRAAKRHAHHVGRKYEEAAS